MYSSASSWYCSTERLSGEVNGGGAEVEYEGAWMRKQDPDCLGRAEGRRGAEEQLRPDRDGGGRRRQSCV